MPPRPSPSRVAAALDYLQRLKSGVGEFVGGVGNNLADRARAAGGLAYEALTTDPNIGRMTTAEFSQAAADRAPTPRLDQAARDIGTIGRAIVTQPVETGKAIVGGEIDRFKGAFASPQAAGEYAGSLIDPMRLAAALRHRIPISELDVYHGTPHRFPATEANPLGEFDASKIGTGEGAQAYGHGVYLAESPGVANAYKTALEAGKGDRDEDVIARLLAATKGDRAAAAEEFRRRAEFANYPEGKQRMLSLAEKVESGVDPRGSLYKADLPDEMIDRMLDYDKPINEQSPAVLDALERAGINTQSTALAGPMAQGQEAHLAKHGIPGLKYLDEGSRNTAGKWIAKHPQGGETAFNTEAELNAFLKRNPEMAAVKPKQTRNFVVFPGEEKKVRILERNGQPAPERIAQALEAAPSKAAKVEPQPFGLQGYLDDDLRRVKQNFFSQYGLEEGKQFSKDYEVIELSKLKPTENTNESKIQSLMKTMREEGNAKDNPIPPIIVDSEGNILDGHHRYEAAKRLGAKYVPVVELFDKQKGPSFSE